MSILASKMMIFSQFGRFFQNFLDFNGVTGDFFILFEFIIHDQNFKIFTLDIFVCICILYLVYSHF